MSIEPIGTQGVTPEYLLEEIKKDIHLATSLVVIVFNKEGQYTSYYSAKRSELSYAAAIIQRDAMRNLE